MTMVTMMAITSLSKSTASPVVKCSLLSKSDLFNLSLARCASGRSSMARSQMDKIKKISGDYMWKMEQKYNHRLQKRLKPKGVRISEGIPPSLLSEIDEGLKGVLRRRQRVLDKIFMENVTEVFATNPIGDFIKENGVIFTQCEVTKDYHILQIYYYCEKSQCEKVVKELNRSKEMLRSLLTQKYIMGKIPTIEYMYDLSYERNSVLTGRLSSLDFGPMEGRGEEGKEKEKKENRDENREADSPERPSGSGVGGRGGGAFVTNENFIPPKPQAEKFKPLGTSRRIKMVTPYDPEQANRFSHNPYENQKALSRFLTFDHPDDMRLDTFSLDYKNMINKILFNLGKGRSPSQAFNPISEALPPVDWSAVKPMPRVPPDMNDPAQNFRGRVLVMKKFIIEDRKKKQLLARQATRMKEQKAQANADNIEKAFEAIGYTENGDDDIDTTPLDDYEYLHSKLDSSGDNSEEN